MRPILYKGLMHSNEWVFGEPLILNGTHFIRPEGLNGMTRIVQKGTIMQFTGALGFKAFKGERVPCHIFEGDIVVEYRGEDRHVGIVWYCEDLCAFQIYPFHGSWESKWTFGLRVIGNVFQNFDKCPSEWAKRQFNL